MKIDEKPGEFSVHPIAAITLSFLFGAALAGATAFPLAAQQPTEQQRPAVVVATEGAYPPFTTLDAKGEPAGFEVDLVRALCEQAQLTCTVVSDEWENLFGGLARRQYDTVISSVEITPERRKRFAFSVPYYRVPSAYLAQKEDMNAAFSEAMLLGKKIGVVADGGQDMLLRKRFGDAVTIVRYASLEEAALDVGADRIDFALLDKFELQKWLDLGKQASCCTMAADAAYDPEVFGEGYGMVFRKSDKDLRARFDAALRAVFTNGVYDAVRARWFPFDIR